MDSEPKKPEIDWEPKFWQEMDDESEQEEEMNPSGEDDDVDRLEWEHERREMDEMEKDIWQGMWEDFGGSESVSEEDSDEDEEEDEDNDDLMDIDEVRKCVSGKA
jgi:hypothetical protein